MIEGELRRWGKFLSKVDKAVDAAYEIKIAMCEKDIAHSGSRVSSNLKLPRVEWPTFNGDVLKLQTSRINLKLQCIRMFIYQMFRGLLIYALC